MNIKELYQIFKKHPHVSTDSRQIEPGVIYFALKGEKFDGNKFAAQALSDGAAYAVIDNPDYKQNERTILVDDVLTTLQKLANYHIKQLKIPVLAITGTNGKTTTKELIKAVLSQKYNVLATTGNLNNHIGVPLTLLSITHHHNFAVIEMGANHPLEIQQLCNIAEPQYGIITNIGKAHLEGFGGFEGVIKTKKELYDFIISNNGTLFYNYDNTILSKLLENTSIKKIDYSSICNSYCKGNIVSANPFVNIKVFIKKDNSYSEASINSQLIGAYNLENILAAVSIGNYFDVDLVKIKIAIENYNPQNNRSQLTKSSKNTLILDCYNANPSSTDAALRNLMYITAPKKLAILGDMLELGNDAEKEHTQILELLKNNNIEALLTGPIYKKLSGKFGYKAFSDVEELNKWLQSNPISDYLILIKGSRGIKLEKIVETL